MGLSDVEYADIERVIESGNTAALMARIIDKQLGYTKTDEELILREDQNTYYRFPISSKISQMIDDAILNISGPFQFLSFTPQATPPTSNEGDLFYDDAEKTFRFNSDNPNFINWVNNAATLLATNETGSLIPRGTAVDVHDINTGGTGFLIHPADQLGVANNNDEGWVIAVTTEDIPNGGTGTICLRGTVLNIDTSALTPGKPAYVGTAGALTNTRPNYPAKAILVGSAITSNATTGILGVLSKDDQYDYEFDGCILEKHQYQIVEGTGVDTNDVVGQLYCDVWNLDDPTRDLPVQLGGTVYQLNTTTGDSPSGYARVQLNQGTTTNAQFNRVYIKINGGAAELAVTTGYPSSPFATVGRMSIWDDTKFATDGVKNNRRTTSSKQYDSMGIIKTILEALGSFGPRVESDVTPTGSISANVMDAVLPACDVYQTFRQSMPQLSVVTDGIYVANGPGGSGLANNSKYNDLKDLAGYTNVDEARDTSCTGSIFIFAAINKETSECKLFANLPSRVSSTNSAGGRDEYFDNAGNTNYNGTPDGKYVEFAVMRVAYHYNGGNINFLTSAGATTTSPDSLFSLIGNPMGLSGGGGGGGGADQNLLQVLTEGSDGGGIDQTNLGSLAVNNGESITVGVDSVIANGNSYFGNDTTRQIIALNNLTAGQCRIYGFDFDTSGLQDIAIGGSAIDGTKGILVDASENRVGINEDTPDTFLHVKSEDNSQNTVVTVEATGSGVYSGIELRTDNGAGAGRIRAHGTTSGNAEELHIANSYGDLVFLTDNIGNPSEAMRIDTNGNIGFGTNSPDIVGKTIHIQDSSAPRILFDNTGASGRNYGVLSTNTGLFGVYDYDASAYRWAIDSNGNAGVGTTSPDNILGNGLATQRAIKTYSATEVTRLIAEGNGATLDLADVGASTNNGWTQISLDGDKTTIRSVTDAGAEKDVFMSLDNANGNVGIGTTSPTDDLDINGDTVRLRTQRTITNSNDTGTAGEICHDANYIYVCTATNTWKRAALSTW